MTSLITLLFNPSLDEWKRRINVHLVRTARLDLDGKSAAEISLGEIFGAMDSLSYLILLVSLAGAVVIGCWCGLLLAELRPNRPGIVALGVIPGVISAVLIWTALFRLRYSLRNGKGEANETRDDHAVRP